MRCSRLRRAPFLGALLALSVALSSCARPGPAGADPYSGWSVYGGTGAGDHYSSLAQINSRNVQRLRMAWRYDTGSQGDAETNPIVVGGKLFAYTADLHVIALDAAHGTLLWEFDPGIRGGGPSRGLTFWTDGQESRLFAGVMHLLFALDPKTGRPVPGFGDAGHIDLRSGLGGEGSSYFVSLTSPGVLYKDLLIVGFRTAEVKPAAPGDIRAYDVRTGSLRWRFRTIPENGEPGSETWPPDARRFSGAANNWAGMTLDAAHGIVFVPTGSAVNDFYGADRLGDDLYANTLLALDAATGRKLWHFQIVHHDILDRDLPAPPVLATVRRDGRSVDVVAQPTKHGQLFVFERLSGRPFFPIVERPIPESQVPGESASRTQPFPTLPAPFARQQLTDDLLTTRTPQAHEWAVGQLHAMRSEGPFTPAGVDLASVVFPGFDGGAEWGGAAVDPRSAIIYINANDVAWSARLAANVQTSGRGSSLYQALCSACHGPDRKGSPPAFPSLTDIASRLPRAQIAMILHTGRGRMPPFANVQGADLDALLAYLETGRDATGRPDARSTDTSAAGRTAAQTVASPAAAQDGAARESPPGLPFPLQDPTARYRFTGYQKFLDPDGYPAVAPPWGTLSAIDLSTGRYVWRVPLGEYPELVAKGLRGTGSENYGGPIVTAGGVLFIGATVYDHKLRAYDSHTGQLLWEGDLPFAGTATPATYRVDGRQYVVIATSNARNRTAPQGTAYVAFALP